MVGRGPRSPAESSHYSTRPDPPRVPREHTTSPGASGLRLGERPRPTGAGAPLSPRAPNPQRQHPIQKPAPQKRTGRAHPSGGTDSVSPKSSPGARPIPSANTPSTNPRPKNGRAEPIPPEGLTPSVPNLPPGACSTPSANTPPKNPRSKNGRAEPIPPEGLTPSVPNSPRSGPHPPPSKNSPHFP